jgi:hypothetical protein
MNREKIGSREMTEKEKILFTQIEELMDIINEYPDGASEEAKQRFTNAIMSSEVANLMLNKYIMTEQESIELISVLKDLAEDILHNVKVKDS